MGRGEGLREDERTEFSIEGVGKLGLLRAREAPEGDGLTGGGRPSEQGTLLR